MPKFPSSSPRKYWFDPGVRKKQHEEILQCLSLLSHLLEVEVKSDSPNQDLTDLLCEYITNARLFRDIMEELKETKLEYNEAAQEEQHLLSKSQVDALKSHASLVMFNDYDLLTKWGINLTIH